MVTGIVLAAGEARRMGQQKLLLDFNGRPILLWVLSAVLASDLAEVICVVREQDELPRKIDLDRDRVRWVTNEKAHEGQSTSVVAGLKMVSIQSSAALFVVGDQPLIRTELINGLIDLHLKSAAPVVAPVFRGETRNPVLFHRDLFPELLQLTGDRGGKVLMEKYREKGAFLQWDDEAPFLDLDVWQDYERLKVL
ncbi:MAG: nucleotidyltransferase family protein [Candidatus Binatia bacterium]|jgi:molybdenum cofactor cytidylyltransferase